MGTAERLKAFRLITNADCGSNRHQRLHVLRRNGGRCPSRITGTSIQILPEMCEARVVSQRQLGRLVELAGLMLLARTLGALKG